MLETPLHYQTFTQLAAALRTGEITALQLTEALLERIQSLDPALHAFKRVLPDQAIAAARAADYHLAQGLDNPLLGLPYAVKDLYDVSGVPTGAGLDLLDQNIAERTCTAVERLNNQGMVLLGKTHTVQFAFGAVGINHNQGTPHNPWSQTTHYAPGGSSSGSGVAVSSGMIPMALGSDTGGSVRIPAALNGVVGLKTTVGRISRMGVYPLSWSFDTVGPLTRSVEDAALAYQAMSGSDPHDSSTTGRAPDNPLSTLKKGVKGLRLRVVENLFFEDADPQVSQAVRAAADALKALGADVESIEWTESNALLSSEKRHLVVAAEAYSTNQKWLESHFDALDPVVAWRMIAGKSLPAWEYHAMMREWEGLRARCVESLADIDALLVPTCPIPAQPIDLIDASEDSYRAHNLQYLRNTSIGNTLNLCGVSVPCGFMAESGMPIGLQVYAKPFCEAMALRVAYEYEQISPWRFKHPLD